MEWKGRRQSENIEDQRGASPGGGNPFGRGGGFRMPGGGGGMRRAGGGMSFGTIIFLVILYFIILSTGATLHPAGQTEIESAAQAASALEPLAGPAAKWLFAAGVVGVGFLAVPVMSTGAAYDLVQGVGREGHLNAKVGEAKLFYAVIVLVTIVAVALNFLGFNPMRALVWSGIVQGFSVPPLLCAMMVMTGDRRMMGARRNGWLTTMLGWITVLVTFAAAISLIVAWAS